MSKNPKTPALQSKNGIALYIPTPCHENWDAMTPVEQGRFCQSCAKEVVDFSMMTDQEVLSYFSKATGNTCGRFNNDQLQRPLQPTKIEKKKTWWLAAMMPLMMLFNRAGAQGKIQPRHTPQYQVADDQAPQLLGMVIRQPEILRNIKGIVLREADRKPIPFATITAGGEFVGIADSLGRFNVTIPGAGMGKNLIEASADGYKTGGNAFLSSGMKDYTIALAEEEIKLEDIVIPYDLDTIQPPQATSTTGSAVKTTYEWVGFGDITSTKTVDTVYCTQTLGFTITAMPVRKVSLKDTLVNIFSNPVTIYPNPAPRGSNVTITFKDEDDYNVQVFDNSGKLVMVNNYSVVKAAPQMPLNIPSYLQAGTYYVRLVSKKNKKQYTSKLIVM